MDDARYPASTLVRWFWKGYARASLPWMLAATVFMVIQGATMGGLAYMVKPMFDEVFISGDTGAVYRVAFIVCAIFLGRALAGYLQRVLMAVAARKVSVRLKTSIVHHVLGLDSSFFLRHSPGKLMERVNGDTSAAISIVSSTFTAVGRDVTALISLLVVAFAADWLWALLALVATPFVVFPIYLLQMFLRRVARRMRNVAARTTTRLDEIFHGIESIKLNAIEDYENTRYSGLVSRLASMQIRATSAQAAIPALMDVVAGLGLFTVLIVGGMQIIEGQKTVGDFMSFFTAIGLVFEPVRRLAGLSGNWQKALVSMERVYAVFEQRAEVVSPARPEPMPPNVQEADITLNAVDFAYGDSPVLHDVSFTARAGQTTALVGASGAGKTTVFKLVSRLADPSSGSVELGGTDISRLDLKDLRGLISVVTQDTILFDESVRRNIVLNTKPDEAHLRTALDAAHVGDFLPALEDGLETEVGPRGSNLSGGQRQRVAIARAVLRDTPILLLDEATSALDSESEAIVQRAIESLSKGKTTLVIAHRLSTIRNADKIVVMDRGRVIEQGTHSELLARNGHYAWLHKLQFGDETSPDS